ncbi:cyclic nucleotide-binding domain-containing protein [Teredinibacter waterburyi]|jgi:cAMP-binding proteins - catabolite gene activator and regulatory subunit of cAMP-dependent protein kinases|uniref:cyclic nucleotide-binding domain-containing protein n=1 Tax=Teredinibacter waterburyi TaxID=1500538 RepID=UPI00165ED3E5|nr:cyclic nucleotide-binding domain-containing protein [Teredinibacter waterburyi]
MLDLKKLKSFVPFNGLEDEYLEEALAKIEVQEFSKGQMIFKRGRVLANKYFLLDGQVDLINSAFYVSTQVAGSESAKITLNVESPTLSSAVAKSSSATVFSIETELLDRLIAWSQSAASASFDQTSTPTSEFEVEDITEVNGGDWMSALLQSPLFAKIPLTQVQELFLRFQDVALDAGDVVVKEGERGDYFYVVVAGQARVTNRLGSIDVELRPGQFFGEEALLGNTPRNATISMETKGRLKRLNSDDFMALLKAPVVRYVENQLLDKLEKPYKLLDVKMPMEFRSNHFPGAVNIPLSRLRNALPELGHSNVYVVPDDAGSRADIAAHLLCQAGFDAVILKSGTQ